MVKWLNVCVCRQYAAMHHCNNPPLQPSHKPSMKCYCLVAQSTMWSSCDCINLSDLISCSHGWEKEKEREIRKFEVREKNAAKQAKKKTIQICFVSPLKPSSLSFYLWFVLRWRTETLDIQKCRFGTELSNKPNWSSDLCEAPPRSFKSNTKTTENNTDMFLYKHWQQKSLYYFRS